MFKVIKRFLDSLRSCLRKRKDKNVFYPYSLKNMEGITSRPCITTRSPNFKDTKFEVGQIWINDIAVLRYVLKSKTKAAGAVWERVSEDEE